jgi:AcrR family transcriptional regulator
MFNFVVRLFNTRMQASIGTASSAPIRQRRNGASLRDAPGVEVQATARPDRKADILLAAEKLFAQRGYHGVTIRQIAQEAAVPLALVGYYYGPKQALFQAIFAHWNGTIEERMSALQAIALDAQNPNTLPAIIEAFIGPVLRLRASHEGEYYALLVARELYHATDETDQVLRAYFDPLAHAFIDAMNVVLPHATRGQVSWAYQFALGALLHHIIDARVGRLSRGENTRGDPSAAPLLGAFIVGGIRAALPGPGDSHSQTQRKPSPASLPHNA